MARRRSILLLIAAGFVAACLVLVEVVFMGEPALAPAAPTQPAAGPLQVSANGRYFATPDGRPLVLTGSHTWQNFQDTGHGDPPPAFDYPAYLRFLEEQNHNFFRLWVWEQAQFSNEISRDDYFSGPSPYQKAGGRFDLDKFDPAYFSRLRERVSQAGQRGIYVSVMLFNGWSIEACKGELCDNNPWTGHPFNKANNVNGVDGDLNGNGSGEETQTLAVAAVTARQEAYVRKVVDTVGDLDNVLYEISNEGPANSAEWQYHMISYLKSYEPGEKHPVGMTSTYPGNNQDLWNSPADWISPNGDLNNPPATDGRKVVLADTDHLCGLCGDSSWPWRSFTRGENPIYMDAYDGAYGIGGKMTDKDAVAIRANLGHVRDYASRLDLTTATPRPDLCSTGFCLVAGTKYLVFSPGGEFTVDLGKAQGRTLSGQWLDPDTGATTAVADVRGESSSRFTPPFDGPAVLLLER
ncbi:MAG: DUF4038 domain-containing protein [Kibdelosporangium sp.]